MSLGTSGISTTLVANTLGLSTHKWNDLCSSTKINTYSRYRPGYWYVSGTSLLFNYEKGGGYADPRGSDPQGFSGQVNRAGDFRGYNHSAQPPLVNGMTSYDLYLPSGSTAPTEEMVIDVGEVDWFGEETLYRGRNMMTYDTVYAVMISSTGQYVIKGQIAKSAMTKNGSRLTGSINVTLTWPTDASYTVTNEVHFGLGLASSGKCSVLLPNDPTKTIVTHRVAYPVYYIGMQNTETVGNTIFSRLSGYSGTDTTVWGIDITPSSGTLATGVTSFSFISSDAIIVTWPSKDQLRITATKWTVTGVVDCYNSSNTKIASSSFTGVMWSGSQGKYTINVTLPNTSQSGYIYYIRITDMATTSVTKI